MTNYERDNLQPDDSKEIQTTECEDCSATGFIYCNDSDVPEDPQPIKEECLRCSGKGYLEY